MKWLEKRGFIAEDLCYDTEHQVWTYVEKVFSTEETKRYVVRRKKYKDYYTGNQTFNTMGESFGKFEKAKVFKNVAGAKNACMNLELHMRNRGERILDDFEIVEILTVISGNIIDYEHKIK